MNCPKGFRGHIRENEPLAGLTSWKIGGPAKFIIEPDSEKDLSLMLAYLEREGAPFLVLGGGSNLLVDDSGVGAAVLRLCSPKFRGSVFRGCLAEAGAGVPLKKFVASAMEAGLCGFEFLAGIPGTIGGAVMMNAGKGREGGAIADIVEGVTVVDYSGRRSELPRRSINFSYRESGLGDFIITSVKFKLGAAADSSAVKKRIKEYAVYRVSTQDLTRPSAGCVFRNPPGDSAGRLIDACGLKGRRYGGAAFSERHANFIVNLGAAGSSDVRSLMESAVSSVKERFSVTLEPEVKLWR
ncbi:MAG: UDP-N-acetylmuramate dehydrogenase [Candidatus Omnitrophota bacterium]